MLTPQRFRGMMDPSPDTEANTMQTQTDRLIEHDGDRWLVLSTGTTRAEDGFVYCHLASTTRSVPQRNGKRPVQMVDWVDPAKLGDED